MSPLAAWHIACLVQGEAALLHIQDGFCGDPQDLFSLAVISFFICTEARTHLPRVLNFALDQSKHAFEMTPAGPELGLSCPGCMFQDFLL